MENRLLHAAIGAFILELIIFLGISEVLPVPFISPQHSVSQEDPLGEIVVTRSQVRRRGFDSTIWEDSEARDRLFENDSVLTLKGSAAKLKLKNNVNIDLHENTLVVIEPMSNSSEHPFRLKFARGDLRSLSQDQGVILKSGEWTINAAPGADLSLRAVSSGEVEVEVSAGEVDVQHETHGTRRQVLKDQRLVLSREEASEVIQHNQELRWLDPRNLRVYSHQLPVDVDIRWQGHAESLKITSPSRNSETIALKAEQDRIQLPLAVGNYYLTLVNGRSQSRSLMVEVLAAPKMIHLSPLPRDRLKTGMVTTFSWLSELGSGSHYALEISTDEGFKNTVLQRTATQKRVDTEIPQSGSFFWRVIGFDEDNFLIPANYSYPLYTDPDPLAPPKLRAPTAAPEEPDDQARTFPRHPFLKALSLFFWSKRTVAEDLPPVIFNWEPLPGADYYIVEISSRSNFENPEVIVKTSTHFYAWSRFKKGIYYYRVAGGSKQGRLGQFTAPEKVDLTQWPPPKVAKKQPAQPPKPAPSPPPPPAPPPSKVVETPKVVTPTQVIAPPEVTEKAEPLLPPRAQIWYEPSYGFSSNQQPQDAKVRVQGPRLTNVGLAVQFAKADQQWNWSLRYEQYHLKPKSEGQLPFQADLEFKKWTTAFEWAWNQGPWSAGITWTQIPQFKRVDLEELSLSSNSAVGPSFSHSLKNENSTQTLSGAVVYSAENLLLLGSAEFRTPFKESYFYGGNARAILAISGASYSDFQLGLMLGIGW